MFGNWIFKRFESKNLKRESPALDRIKLKTQCAKEPFRIGHPFARCARERDLWKSISCYPYFQYIMVCYLSAAFRSPLHSGSQSELLGRPLNRSLGLLAGNDSYNSGQRNATRIRKTRVLLMCESITGHNAFINVTSNSLFSSCHSKKLKIKEEEKNDKDFPRTFLLSKLFLFQTCPIGHVPSNMFE